MKIIFYISTLSGGGAARVMVNLANYFARDGFQVALVTNLNCESAYPIDNNVIRRSIDSETGYRNFVDKNMVRVYRLRKIMKSFKADAVVSFRTENNMRCILASAFLGVNTYVSVVSDPKRECGEGLKGGIIRRLYDFADGNICQTPDALAWFSKKAQQKGKVILNLIDEGYYQTVGVDKNKKGIISVGRFEEVKNHKMLISAFSKIADVIDEDLTIYGDGPLRAEYEKLITSLGLEERVHLPGNQADMVRCYDEAKLFVLSSDKEGLPNVLMEAMTRGTACIATNCPCGGPKLLLEDGKIGVLVPVNDEKALAEAMLDLMLNNRLRGELEERSLTKSNEFKTERVYLEWKEFVFDKNQSY